MRADPLTDEQREIRELVRTLTRERIAPRAAEIDSSAEFPWDMVELLREHQIFGLAFEERHGGADAGPLMLLVAVDAADDEHPAAGGRVPDAPNGDRAALRGVSDDLGLGRRRHAERDR
jgi:alkylation response protein AidB-like acyl-CoA dehydrogenase